ncbi:MAG: DegT/DnrJ/EryC1/StrS family aminotransferase, partial [Nodosilinea sp.]
MTVIPAFDVTEQFQTLGPEINRAVAAVLASGQYINGPAVAAFAHSFREYVGTEHCVVCNSG